MAAAKKATAKKATAKKATAKKATARKTSAKKTAAGKAAASRPRPRAQVVLKPNAALAKLHGDLQSNPLLRQQMTEDPQVVLKNYELEVNFPTASMMVIRGGMQFPQNPG